ncbi:MAG TPA: glycosyltransferase family 39 protein [Candidatus Limnocylindrales bacterium]|jgi:4-amino-4-deoxy-L-arabinose transferase-like glycosyltransferase|nr:glycosyltransferase family 39 protein [Candidatus Limnocylindrales bacterium]
MFLLQNLIHYLEVGSGFKLFSRASRTVLVVLGGLLLLVAYDFNAFRNMGNQEAMDSAQLARNIAEGKGYTTLFVRPLSMFLIKQHNRQQDKGEVPAPDQSLTKIKGMHPDIANPPVYPLTLAGLMKVLPFNFSVDTTHAFWSRARNATQRDFIRYQPDFLIALFNQSLFIVLMVLVFFWARRLFDPAVAWLSTLLLLGSELLWRFTVSGLSTMLLLVITMGLVWCLTLFDLEARDLNSSSRRKFLFASLCGVLVGLGTLTRYSFGWMILPVILFLTMSGKQRALVPLTAFALFALVLAPWCMRNYSICGMPFGTASYAVVENSAAFPEYRLERSLDPDFSPINFVTLVRRKLVGNTRQIIANDLPKMAGTWVSGFFLAGLLIGFKNPTVRRLRYFLITSLLVLSVAQALGRTQLWDDSPEINCENLLVLLAPLVVVYGSSLFFLLLDQMALPFLQLRYAIIGLFITVLGLPLLLVFLPPRINPLSYPPYYPPAIQQIAGWTKPEELMMSDIPWAVAWYGQAQCVWLTLNCQSAFLSINDYEKPIQALYLSRVSLDGRFLSQWVRTGDKSWGEFILNCLFRKAQGKPGPPPGFPLQNWQPGWPDQFLLTFREHWPRSS